MVDFTKFTIVDDGSVSCFVVAVVSHDEDHVAGNDDIPVMGMLTPRRRMETTNRLL